MESLLSTGWHGRTRRGRGLRAYHRRMRATRRDVLRGSLAMGVAGAAPVPRTDSAPDVPPPIAALTPMTGVLAPITVDEHRGRIARAQALMASEGLKALVLA